MKYLSFSQTKIRSFLSELPARISPKEISGANGKFLPKPLLFHLRHPNSKTNGPKFWQILSPKNSFAKTSSALKPRHTARILGGQNPKKKNVLSIFRKNWSRANPKSKEHFFFLGLPSEARQWRNDTSVRFSFKPPRAPRVAHHLFWKWVRAWYNRDTEVLCDTGRCMAAMV